MNRPKPEGGAAVEGGGIATARDGLAASPGLSFLSSPSRPINRPTNVVTESSAAGSVMGPPPPVLTRPQPALVAIPAQGRAALQPPLDARSQATVPSVAGAPTGNVLAAPISELSARVLRHRRHSWSCCDADTPAPLYFKSSIEAVAARGNISATALFDMVWLSTRERKDDTAVAVQLGPSGVSMLYRSERRARSGSMSDAKLEPAQRPLTALAWDNDLKVYAVPRIDGGCALVCAQRTPPLAPPAREMPHGCCALHAHIFATPVCVVCPKHRTLPQWCQARSRCT